MKSFLELLDEAKKDNDIADLPPQYKKALAPFEGDITSAYVDEKSNKTIVYINTKEKLKDIEKAVGKENIDSVDKTSDDIKITLK